MSDRVKEILLRWVAHALILWAVVAAGKALHMQISLRGFWDAVLTVFVLACANTVVRPVMKTLLLPLNCLSLGLLGFAVNVLVLWVVSELVPGFEIGSVGAAVFCAVMLSILGGIVNRFLRLVRED